MLLASVLQYIEMIEYRYRMPVSVLKNAFTKTTIAKWREQGCFEFLTDGKENSQKNIFRISTHSVTAEKVNMKNESTIKSSKTDSPKTPGGISRSLLTPCRRLGLSRNFRKSGASPFQSPLPSNTEVKQEKVETRKRKEYLVEIPETSENVDECDTPPVVQTPTRTVALPRRKKCKTLLASINKSTEPRQEIITATVEEENLNEVPCKGTETYNPNVPNTELLSTPVRLKSKSRSKKKISPSNSITKQASVDSVDLGKENLNNIPLPLERKEKEEVSTQERETKEKSPNNLTKECIVVIQKKIFKKELKEKLKPPTFKEKSNDTTPKPQDMVSQAVFDSDSDDVPLICLNNKETETKPSVPTNIDVDDDFATSKTKIKKTETTRLSKLKTKSPTSKNKNSSKVANVEIQKPPNFQSSVDEDDDFFEKKRTILIRKNYDKLMKPQKAKSTGSITQKDIDDLKARIEVKKKMLLARALTEDTKELRDLIKKWQKGCQDALLDLMELMKNKFSDNKNMGYSEILQTLKIPPSLVGYDSDNDCFLTPDDETIILANVNEKIC